MSKIDFIKRLSAQISGAMPKHLHALKSDIEKNCHAVLTKGLAKFDLVTREEFDTQSKVLSRSRKKLIELEKHIKELEDLLKSKRVKK